MTVPLTQPDLDNLALDEVLGTHRGITQQLANSSRNTSRIVGSSPVVSTNSTIRVV